MSCRSCLCILDVDRISVRLKEAESTVEDVRVDELGDQVVYQLHSYLLLSVFTKEFWIRVFEDDFDLHANGKHNHGHIERHKDALSCILCLQLGLNLGDRNEELLAMVHV